MKFIGYFDISGMSAHEAITHLTEEQQDNYRQQILDVLRENHFQANLIGGIRRVELAVVTDQIIVQEQVETPFGPPQTRSVALPRHRLQYTVDLQALPAPKASGLILPGQQNGLNQIKLRPLPEEGDA